MRYEYKCTTTGNLSFDTGAHSTHSTFLRCSRHKRAHPVRIRNYRARWLAGVFAVFSCSSTNQHELRLPLACWVSSACARSTSATPLRLWLNARSVLLPLNLHSNSLSSGCVCGESLFGVGGFLPLLIPLGASIVAPAFQKRHRSTARVFSRGGGVRHSPPLRYKAAHILPCLPCLPPASHAPAIAAPNLLAPLRIATPRSPSPPFGVPSFLPGGRLTARFPRWRTCSSLLPAS